MAGPLQFEAPTALAYFGALVADEASLPVLEAAIAVWQDDDPGLDVQGVMARIDGWVEHLRIRIPADAAPLQRLRLLNQYYFQELGFGGNVNDYYDLQNSSVAAVVLTRRGIPLTLALIYIEMAGQLGLKAHGVSFPGHFLVKVETPHGEIILDPFDGRSLDREELEERLLPYRQQRGLSGDDEIPLGLFLQAATRREMVARLLRNLKEIHRSARDWVRLAAVTQRLVILLPEEWSERRDLGLVLARNGRTRQAIRELDAYLQNCPNASDAPALRRELAVWRRA
jgi:regulator of sirC expression with transglutaminase-like and TPR domain